MKGCAKFQQNVNRGFRFSLPENGEISWCRDEEILPFFGTLNLKPGFRFCWNFAQSFTVRAGNCCVNLLLRQFLFYRKPSAEISNLGLLPGSKKFCQFLLGWIGNEDSDFAETFHNPSLSGQEGAVSLFSSRNFIFQTKPTDEIWNFDGEICLRRRESQNF